LKLFALGAFLANKLFSVEAVELNLGSIMLIAKDFIIVLSLGAFTNVVIIRLRDILSRLRLRDVRFA
jgi:hypothetical protein